MCECNNYHGLSVKILQTYILFFSISLFGNEAKEVPDFGDNPGNLKMYLHLPTELKNNKISVVIALHGCSQNASIIEKQSGWSKLADENNFIVIYPQQKYSNNGMRCFRWYSYDKKEAKEMTSIISMLEHVAKMYLIDSSRVFVYGLSAGAMMSGALMLHYPEVFNSGAVLAGGPYKIGDSVAELLKKMKNPDDKSPKEWGHRIPKKKEGTKYPNLIVLHGVKDGIVDVQNARELIDQWSYVLKIDTIPDTILKKYESVLQVEKQIFKDSLGKDRIKFYLIQGIGHTLPVNPGTGDHQGGETGMYAKDIGFFSTYYIAKDFGLIQKED